jgi:hypothetical protein
LLVGGLKPSSVRSERRHSGRCGARGSVEKPRLSLWKRNRAPAGWKSLGTDRAWRFHVRAWRICKSKYVATAFDGEGAFRYGRRWNSRGIRLVYLGGNPSISALEIVVKTDDSEDLYRIPYVLLPVDVDEGAPSVCHQVCPLFFLDHSPVLFLTEFQRKNYIPLILVWEATIFQSVSNLCKFIVVVPTTF